MSKKKLRKALRKLIKAGGYYCSKEDRDKILFCLADDAIQHISTFYERLIVAEDTAKEMSAVAFRRSVYNGICEHCFPQEFKNEST